MAGNKSFTGNTPRTGRQRSAEQVTARIQDVLNFINEFFGLTIPINFGKVFAIDDITGAITVKSALTLPSAILPDHTVVGDIAPNAGTLIQEWAVIGEDKKYKIGPDGSTGQIVTRDALGNLVFSNPPASTNFIDITGNFTASPNVNYNVDALAQITINTADVVPGFTVRIRPKHTVNFETDPAVVLYNGVNPFENQTTDLELNIQAEYTIYSQDGVALQIAVTAASTNI